MSSPSTLMVVAKIIEYSYYHKLRNIIIHGSFDRIIITTRSKCKFHKQDHYGHSNQF